MLQVLGICGAVIVLLIVAVLVLAANRPSTFRVERSATVHAPPERVFALLVDFRQWPAWSPWEKMDPAMTKTHSGAASGKGAVYEWKGNNKVGEGRMEIVDAAAPSKLTIKLDFLKPFSAHNTAEFTLRAQAGDTALTWAMYGPQAFMVKVMSVFMSMDRMIGRDFEAGLAGIKSIAESQA